MGDDRGWTRSLRSWIRIVERWTDRIHGGGASDVHLRHGFVLLVAALCLAGPTNARSQRVPVVLEHGGSKLLSRPAKLMLSPSKLADGLAALQQTSGVALAFSPTFLPDDRVVTCRCKHVTVAQAIDSLLAGTGLRYAVLNGQVIVERVLSASHPGPVPSLAVPPTASAAAPQAAPPTVRAAVPSPVRGSLAGTVVAARTQQPLAHSDVVIEGTSLRTVTDAAGRFRFDDLPLGAVAVRARLIGYRGERRLASVGESGVRIELPVEPLELDRVVVTGTAGEVRARQVGNSIDQIDLRNVAEPARNLELLLQGRVPGLNLNMGSATMGAGAAIRLRGNVSVSQTNQPLIYVDGVRQTTDAYPRNVSANGPSHRGNNVQASPLNDIDVADVERIEILKGAAAATLYGTEAAAGVIQIFTKRGIPGTPSWTYQMDRNLTWIRPFGSSERPLAGMEPWLETGHGQKHSLSVRGGSESSQYFLSGGYVDGGGVLPGDEETRYSVRGNLSLRTGSSLNLDFSAFFTHHDVSTAPTGNSDESIFWNVYRAPNGLVPLTEIDRLLDLDINSVNDRKVLGATAVWAPLTRLTNRFVVGLDQARSHNRQFRPFGYIVQPEGDVTEVLWESRTLTVDHVSTLHLDVTNALRTSLSVGGQFIRSSESVLDGYGRGLPGPGKHTLSSAALRAVTQEQLRENAGGFFLQTVFDLKNRYFLTAGLRVDGSSAFGSDFGLQPYPKVNAAYVISDEPFWRDGWGQVKLRAAYGFAGRGPGAFDAVRTWRASSFLGETGFLPDNVGNPELGPERTGELEVGFDASFLNDRLSTSFTYYHQNTTEALFPVAQPASLGFSNPQLENVGALTNRGIELAIQATPLRGAGVTWDVGATLATNRSEVTELGAATSYYLDVGQPAPVVRGTRVLNPEEYADPIYEKDAFFGPNQPTHVIGLNTTVALPGGVTLSARGEYQGGHYIADYPSPLTARTGAGALACDDVYEIVPWTEYRGPGDAHPNLSDVRALDRARCYSRVDADTWTFRADFFKLREVTAQAPIPFALPGVKNAVVTGSLRNVWRWVNPEFASFDPEIIASRDQITALMFWITDQLPPPASAVLSVRVNF